MVIIWTLETWATWPWEIKKLVCGAILIFQNIILEFETPIGIFETRRLWFMLLKKCYLHKEKFSFQQNMTLVIILIIINLT